MKKRQQRMPAQEVIATIEKFSHDGRGIARINGKTTFIQGALPREVVSFTYSRKKKDFDEGQVVSVLTSSPSRVSPGCLHYDLCGGCSLQHLHEDSQIVEKEVLLLDLLQRIGHCEPQTMLPPLKATSWNYRNKARLSVRYVEKKQCALVGFREKNKPQFIADITSCPILNQTVGSKITHLRKLLDSFVNPKSIAQIEVAAGDSQVALIFRNLMELCENDAQVLKDFGKNTGFKIFLQPSSPDSVSLFYPEEDNEFLSYSLPQYNLHFKFHPTDFTQINASLNEMMVSQALALLDLKKDDIVLDLFCGLGNFSLPLSLFCHQVIGVEGSQAMVERATMNARMNGIENAQFLSCNLDNKEELVDLFSHACTKILLDPPRSGALEIVKQIHHFNPQRIVYVSCNPATLARDAQILVHEKGYQLIAAGVMDMFPHTAHVESIALFEKG